MWLTLQLLTSYLHLHTVAPLGAASAGVYAIVRPHFSQLQKVPKVILDSYLLNAWTRTETWNGIPKFIGADAVRLREHDLHETKHITITVRVRPSVKAKAVKRVAEERRSLTNYLEQLIERDASQAVPKR